VKKQVKVDPETRSYDILTKTHQKIPTIYSKYGQSGDNLRKLNYCEINLSKNESIFLELV